MATVLETIGTPSQIGAALQAGTNTVSQEQTLVFNRYGMTVYPADGYVFWVLVPNSSITVSGSLHFSSDVEQRQDATIVKQNIIFTSFDQIDQFANIAPNYLYISKLQNGSLFAFSSQSKRYQQANLWHYSGRALFSTESTQVVDDPSILVPNDLIVSNSLPIWMQMSTTLLPIYPAFLSPLNIVPPFVTAYIDESTTQAMGLSPYIQKNSSQYLLTQENITFTMYGLDNNSALDFQMMILDGSLNDIYGMMNTPVIKDNKQTQNEFRILSQKKTMEIEVNYYQQTARDISKQLILSAPVTINLL